MVQIAMPLWRAKKKTINCNENSGSIFHISSLLFVHVDGRFAVQSRFAETLTLNSKPNAKS